MAGGTGKGDAIMAALRTGAITDLVIGEVTARHIAERLDRGSDTGAAGYRAAE